MRRVAVVLFVLLLAVPAGAAAAKQPDAAVRVLWNSAPDDVRAGGTWDARVSVLQGPGGFSGERLRPVVVVTELSTGAVARVRMAVDVPPNTFRAEVRFPRAGSYEVDATGFDPSDPTRLADLGDPVQIAPAAPLPATGGGGAWWPWALIGAAIPAVIAGASRAPRSDP